MVEEQRPRPVPRIGDDGRQGVVAASRRAGGPGQEDRRDGVEARVAGRIGVGAELADELDLERGLLAGFPHRGGLERFAVFDEAARQRPAVRRVLPFDEDDAPDPPAGGDLDDDVDRRVGIPVLAAGHSCCGLHRHFRGAKPDLSMKWGRFGTSPFFPRCPRSGTILPRPRLDPRGDPWHEIC